MPTMPRQASVAARWRWQRCQIARQLLMAGVLVARRLREHSEAALGLAGCGREQLDASQ